MKEILVVIVMGILWWLILRRLESLIVNLYQEIKAEPCVQSQKRRPKNLEEYRLLLDDLFPVGMGIFLSVVLAAELSITIRAAFELNESGVDFMSILLLTSLAGSRICIGRVDSELVVRKISRERKKFYSRAKIKNECMTCGNFQERRDKKGLLVCGIHRYSYVGEGRCPDYRRESYRFPVGPQIPRGCNGCANFYGQVHNGNLLVCGIHPYGQENCSDYQE